MPGSKRPAAATNPPACFSMARPSPSIPFWSAKAPRPRSLLPRVSATSTRSGGSTGRMRTICTSASTSRWSSGRCGSRSRSGCYPTAKSRQRSTTQRSRASAACWTGLAWRRLRSFSSTAMLGTTTKHARRRSWRRTIRTCSSPPRMNCPRNIASSSVAPRWWPTPMSGPSSADISARSRTTFAAKASPARS